MKQLAVMKLFQWVRLVLLLAVHCALSCAKPCMRRMIRPAGFRDASLLNGQLGAFYNFIAFIAAFALVPFSQRFGPKRVHAVCLSLAGID